MLTDYTVELRDRGWYFGRPYETSSKYRGPYSTIASLTLMIARQLRKEVERRHRPTSGTRQADQPTQSGSASE